MLIGFLIGLGIGGFISYVIMYSLIGKIVEWEIRMNKELDDLDKIINEL